MAKTKTMTLSLPEEVVRSAEKLAAETQGGVDEILQQWLQHGMVRAVSNASMADGGVEPGEGLSPQEEGQLARLLHSLYVDDLSEESKAQLDELLHRYRHTTIEEARALTDWLALGGTLAPGSPVSQLVTLRSNMLYAVGYDPRRQVLDVIFRKGGVYRYFDVPRQIFQGLLNAPSAGRYMWDHVFGVYSTARLDRKRGTQRVMSRQPRLVGKAA